MSTSGERPHADDRKALRWHHLVHESDEPIFVLNERRQVLYVNPAWQSWSGISAADVRRRTCRPTRANRDEPAQPYLGLIAPPQEVMAGRSSQVRRRCPGSTQWCVIHFLPWTHAGRIQAVLGRIQLPPPGSTSAERAPLPEKVVQLRDQARRDHTLELLESDLPAVRKMAARARLAARTDGPVLLLGPAGAGKTWLARSIHLASSRADEVIAVVDAARTPIPLLEELLFTRGPSLRLGAMVIRRIRELAPQTQARWLERQQEGITGPRLLLTAEAPNEVATLDATFAASVSALTIEVPPLRERMGDWPRLLPHVLARASAAAGTSARSLSADAESLLRLHDWPGNLAELHELLRDASRRSAADEIQVADLPAYVRNAPPVPVPTLPLDQILERTERRLIELALRQCDGNKSKAAEMLSIWRPRLLRRLEQLGLGEPSPSETAGDADAQG